MIAIIVENEEEYVSPVFAIRQAGWQSEVVAFNKENTQIGRIKMWVPRRKVFIVDWEKFGCKKFAWEGYDWVLEEKDLWKALRFQKKANIEDFPQFKAYSKKIILPEWFEIKDERDIQSLMNVSAGFHDSILTEIAENENDTQIEFDTNWGCIITVKFEDVRASGLIDRIGMIYDSVLEKTDGGYSWKVTCFDSGNVGGGIDFLPVSEEPYIDCDKIEWKIKISKSENCAVSKEDDLLSDLYLDLKSVSENVFLKDGKLTLHHKKDTLVIEESPKGTSVFLNGKKKRGKWEEQDIFEYAFDFLTQVAPEDITEEVLADVVSVKALYVWHSLKFALLFAVLWSAVGLLLLFFANVHCLLCTVLFFAVSLSVLIGSLFAAVRNREKRYVVTSTKIYYFDGNRLNKSLNIDDIKGIKLYRSLIKKKIGTIKIKQNGGITFGYGLIAVNEAEKVYHLIRQKIALQS